MNVSPMTCVFVFRFSPTTLTVSTECDRLDRSFMFVHAVLRFKRPRLNT